MKKILTVSSILLMLLIALLTSCSSGSAGSSSPEYPDRADGTWLILVHFGTDNNIDYDFEDNYGIISNYLATLEALEAADTENVLDIVVMMDAYDTTDPGGTGYSTPFTDGYYHLTGGAFVDDLGLDTGEINSGSTLESQLFVNWALSEVPDADYHVYSVFNHGSGFDDNNIAGTYGIAFDDSADDSLSHDELGQIAAFIKSQTGKNLDLFYPYACLMGGVELAYEMKDSADFMVFSEEVFPAEYWSWEALEILLDRPGISGANLGKALCQSAYSYFSDPAHQRYFTLATVDLSKINTLADRIDSFTAAATGYIGSNAGRASLLDFCATQSIQMNTPYYNDLKIFMSNVAYFIPSLASASSAVTTALNTAVVDYQSFGLNYPYCGGLTIFHPLWVLKGTYGIDYSLTNYEDFLSFGSDNTWTDYLDRLDNWNLITADGDEPDDDFGSATTITVDSAAQSHTFHDFGESDYFAVSLTSGQTYTIQTHAQNTPYTDTALILYNASHAEVAVNDDIDYNNGNLFSKIVYTAPSTGTYYIRSFDAWYSLGDYTIDVRTGSYSYSPETESSVTALKVRPVKNTVKPVFTTTD